MLRHKLLVFIVTTFFVTSSVLAEQNTINPMTPRQLSFVKNTADYSYGYTRLAGNTIDSIEGLNRAFFFVNYDIFDKYVLRPVAHGYSSLPSFIRTGTGNFLSNLDDATSSIDNLFLLRVKDSSLSFSRFLINSTLGIAGLFDVASSFGIDKHQIDFATVLGIWGQEQGAYLMIPIYGPTTSREAQGDTFDAVPYMFAPWYVGTGLWAIRGIHNRSLVIDSEGLVDNAFDPYVQTRDVYLMYSEGKINPDAEADNLEESIDESYLDEIDS